MGLRLFWGLRCFRSRRRNGSGIGVVLGFGFWVLVSGVLLLFPMGNDTAVLQVNNVMLDLWNVCLPYAVSSKTSGTQLYLIVVRQCSSSSNSYQPQCPCARSNHDVAGCMTVDIAWALPARSSVVEVHSPPTRIVPSASPATASHGPSL